MGFRRGKPLAEQVVQIVQIVRIIRPLAERFVRPLPSWGGCNASSRGFGTVTPETEKSSGGFTGIAGLREPGDWRDLASRTERVCRGLVDDVILGGSRASLLSRERSSLSSREREHSDAITRLDEISDTLCQTIDAAEFCRHVHQEEAWRRAADEACGHLGAFVHELNTHYGLYSALCRDLEGLQASEEGGPGGCTSSEHRYVGEMLRRDFERFGVHLEGEARDEMTELVGFIQQAGHTYMTNAIDRSKTGEIVVDVGRLRGEEKIFELPAGVFRSVHSSLVASGESKVCNGLLAYCDSEVVREAAWRAYHTYPAENGLLAKRILESRHRVAEIMGFDSFGAYQLHGFSLGGSPGAVGAFLKGINESIRDGVEGESRLLEAFKESRGVADVSGLRPWDREWAINGTLGEESKNPQDLHRMFRVSGFVPGMSALLEEVMGLRLVTVPLGPKEAWAAGVSKVLIEDAGGSGETYGTIYLDLLQRPGKFGGAALFTLRCGRRLSNGEYQLPKVALVANISSSADGSLSFGDLETLCHEFGHAMHSVLSRTELQHLSGTRGPQDIIEVPSHVFERFANDRRALSLMIEHSGQDASMITDRLMAVLESRRRHCAVTKLQKTVHMCLLDQYMHSDRVPRSDFGSARDIQQFMQEHGASGFDAADTTAFPPLRFTHLVGYAGNYYSYLFANCIAAEVWDEGGRDAGKEGRALDGRPVEWPSRATMYDKMLRTGGSVPAEAYVRDLVGTDGVVSTDNGSYPRWNSFLRSIHADREER